MDSQPIFLLSLPRSGSTLLQRILGGHPEISTISEPWILLPMIYSMRPKGCFSEFNYNLYLAAIQDTIKSLPHGAADYHQAIRDYANRIYSQLCKNHELYFLDKTPRYYLIIKEIAEIFPDAKFIFLFRHPLAVFASIIETFNNGRIGTSWNRIDLYKGPGVLADGYELLKEKAIALRFEDLVRYPEENLMQICNYLGIAYLPKMKEQFNTFALKGKLGDPTGVVDYQELATEPINKWKKVFNTEYRKKIARKYILGFGRSVFQNMGYEPKSILEEIDAIHTVRKMSLDDRMSIFTARTYSLLEIPVIKLKLKKFLKNSGRSYIHY